MSLSNKNKDFTEKKKSRRDDLLTEEEKSLKKSLDETTEVNNNFDGVIDLSETRRKRFNVNRGSGNDGVLELNTSDMTIINRLEQLYPKLQKLSQDAAVKQLDMKGTKDEDVVSRISEALTRIDMQMREIIDDIFDSNVSEVCAPEGSMFDPFNGEFRFEHIIDVISKLYENNINDEFRKMSDKMKKRTSKYTKGK